MSDIYGYILSKYARCPKLIDFKILTFSDRIIRLIKVGGVLKRSEQLSRKIISLFVFKTKFPQMYDNVTPFHTHIEWSVR